jgi:hypothetical protein
MEQHTLKYVNNCLNTNIYSYLETSGGQSSNPYLNVVNFLNTRVDYKYVAAQDSCFPALVHMRCSIIYFFYARFSIAWLNNRILDNIFIRLHFKL